MRRLGISVMFIITAGIFGLRIAEWMEERQARERAIRYAHRPPRPSFQGKANL